MTTKIAGILLFSLTSMVVPAQTGGDNIYEFLNLTHSGLISSVGGSNVSLPGINLNFAWHNPALLSSDFDKNLALSYSNYIADINYGLVMYSRSLRKKGNIAGGLTYLNYGSFTEADAARNAVQMVIDGCEHHTVYNYLQKKRTELKKEKLKLWETPPEEK